jgi:hypothetical protein
VEAFGGFCFSNSLPNVLNNPHPFLIGCAVNSPFPAIRDVPSQTRILIHCSRCFLIQHSLHIRKPRSAPLGFLHRSYRRVLPFRRLLHGCRGGMFSLCGSRRFLEALAKRTDHTGHVLQYIPKHPNSFICMVETPMSLGPAHVGYSILRARLRFQRLRRRCACVSGIPLSCSSSSAGGLRGCFRTQYHITIRRKRNLRNPSRTMLPSSLSEIPPAFGRSLQVHKACHDCLPSCVSLISWKLSLL